MGTDTHRIRDYARTAVSLVICGGLIAGVTRALDTAESMRLGGDMAVRGNWGEASYRWEQVRKERPDDPFVLNNLAVAYEAMGRGETAAALFLEAAASSSGHRVILENARRFYLRNQRLQAQESPDAVDVDQESFESLPSARKKSKAKTIRVPVDDVIPEKLKKLRGDEKLLVTMFLVLPNTEVDPNVELARILQDGFRNDEDLSVIDVVHPPLRANQSVEELLAARDDWRDLGNRHRADLILSGSVNYSRLDVTEVPDENIDGGGDVVPRERFRFTVHLFFINAHTGVLIYRDQIEREVVQQGTDNDPTVALAGIWESLADEVILTISTRVRPDTRELFRKHGS